MPAVYIAAMPVSLLTVVGICVFSWILALFLLLLMRSRGRRMIARYRRQLGELSLLAQRHEARCAQFAALLHQANCELFDLNERHRATTARLDEMQIERSSRQSLGEVPVLLSATPSRPESTALDEPTQVRKLEQALAEMRRGRELAEQRAEKLRVSNQLHERKSMARTAQFDQLTLAMEEARASLEEKTRELEELQKEMQGADEQIRVLSASLSAAERTRAQFEGNAVALAAAERTLQQSNAELLQLRRDAQLLTSGREQLELQNLELKRMLDQLDRPQSTTSPEPDLQAEHEHLSREGRLGVAADLRGMTESDIRQVVVSVVEQAQNAAQSPSLAELTARPDTRAAAAELREARARIELLEGELGNLKYLRDQNAKLTDEWEQDRGAARELSALQIEHRRLRLELQLATERLSAQAESLESAAELRSELQQRDNEQQALSALRRQLRELHAENFALRNANSGTHAVAKPLCGLASESRELAARLDAAVLSDSLGLPIAARGEVSAESLAAVSGLALSNTERVRELLPVGPIKTVQWLDQYGMAVTCRLLHLAGDEVALTTIGAGNPSEETLQETLKGVLSSIGWNEKGPLEEDETNTATG